ERDPEQERPQGPALIVVVPAAAQRQENFLRKIIDLGCRGAEAAQRPVDVVQFPLERVQAGLVRVRLRRRRRNEAKVTHVKSYSNCPVILFLSEKPGTYIDSDEGPYARRRPGGDLVHH